MKLSWHRQTIRPRHRFATSQGGMSEKQVLIVKLEHEGITGLGEAVPSELYGQSLEASERLLEREAALLGNDPFAIEAVVGRMVERWDGQRALIGAVDSALHDWIGKRLGVPVWRLLGLDRPRIRTTFTLGVAPLDEMRTKLEEAIAAGFEALKLKVGTPDDHAVLSMVRSQFRGPLYLDANEAWTVDEAFHTLPALAAFRPTMIEQPLRRSDWHRLGELRQLCPAPLFVDESCERPEDIARLVGLVDGINIKFTKCGGIREALRMIHLARGLGLSVMLGCFVCSSLAIAPALAIASLVDHADLDGALLLANDPFAGIERVGGALLAPDAAGLGVWRK